MYLPSLISRFLRDRQAAALVEFALVFPFMFLLLFGGIEVTRLILIQQKAEKAGYVLADVTTQYAPATQLGATGEISSAEMTQNVLPVLDRIMRPYNDPARQVVIISSVEKNGGLYTIRWQVAGGGSLSGCEGSVCVESIVNGLTPAGISPAVAGSAAAFPAPELSALAGYVPPSGSGNIIVSEVFYRYTPLLQDLLQGVGNAGGSGATGFRFFLPPRIYAKRTYFIPRQGNLFHLPPDFPLP